MHRGYGLSRSACGVCGKMRELRRVAVGLCARAGVQLRSCASIGPALCVVVRRICMCREVGSGRAEIGSTGSDRGKLHRHTAHWRTASALWLLVSPGVCQCHTAHGTRVLRLTVISVTLRTHTQSNEGHPILHRMKNSFLGELPSMRSIALPRISPLADSRAARLLSPHTARASRLGAMLGQEISAGRRVATWRC